MTTLPAMPDTPCPPPSPAPAPAATATVADQHPHQTRVPWPAKFGALALIWGASFFFMKVGLRSLAPLQISGLRIVSGAAVLVALLAASRGRLPRDRTVWAHLLVSAFFLCTLPFSLFALGEQRVSSALAGIGNATTPIATVVFSLLLLRGDVIGRRKVVGVLVGFLGVLVIMQPWQSTGRPDLVGFGMTLVAGASYGLGWTYNKRFLRRSDLGGLSLPAAQLTVASAQMVVVLFLWWATAADRLPAPWSVHAPATGGSVLLPLLAVLALGVVGTGIAFSLQFDVMRAAGPTVGASVTYVIPVVSVALGVLLLDEHLSWPQLAGAAVVIGAALLIGRPPRLRRTTRRRG
jgi:drug/metabolite transporter (DMT)-like permease